MIGDERFDETAGRRSSHDAHVAPAPMLYRRLDNELFVMRREDPAKLGLSNADEAGQIEITAHEMQHRLRKIRGDCEVVEVVLVRKDRHVVHRVERRLDPAVEYLCGDESRIEAARYSPIELMVPKIIIAIESLS